VESLQPYQGTEEGKFLWSLAKLDNFDKHEEFVVTTNLVREASTTWDGADPPPPASNAQIKFTRQPVEHDTVVARIFYDPPLAEPDPNLKFRPYLSFGGRSPLRDQLVVGTLGALVEVTQHVTALFLPYF
jgi:hypothetical protein